MKELNKEQGQKLLKNHIVKIEKKLFDSFVKFKYIRYNKREFNFLSEDSYCEIANDIGSYSLGLKNLQLD